MQSTVWKLLSLTVFVGVGLICLVNAQRYFPSTANSVAETTTSATTGADAVASNAKPASPAKTQTSVDEFEDAPTTSPDLVTPRKLAAGAAKPSSEPAFEDPLADADPFGDEKPKGVKQTSHDKPAAKSKLNVADEAPETPIPAKRNVPSNAGPKLVADPKSTPDVPTLDLKEEDASEPTPSKFTRKGSTSAKGRDEETPDAGERPSSKEAEPAYNPFDEPTSKDKKSSQGKPEESPAVPELKRPQNDSSTESPPRLEDPAPADTPQLKDPRTTEQSKPETPAEDDGAFPDAIPAEQLLKKKSPAAKPKPTPEEQPAPTLDETPRSSVPAKVKTPVETPPSVPSLADTEETPRPTDAMQRSRTGENETDSATIPPASPPAIVPQPSTPAAPARTEPRRIVESAQQAPKSASRNAGERNRASENRPRLTIEKRAPETAVLGQKMVYTILIKNVSQLPAHQVVVQDEIPVGLELDGTIPRAEMTGRKILWRIGTLGPGEERLIKARVTPMQEGDLGSVATVNFVAEVPQPARNVVTPIPRENSTNYQLELDIDQPRQVRAGETFRVKLTVTNVGTTAMRDIVVRGVLHPLLKHIEVPDSEIDCPIGDLDPGQSYAVDLDLMAKQTGMTVNQIQLLVNQRNVKTSELRIRVAQ